MIYRCVATFVLPDADFADDADERRSFIALKENKSAFLCVICARLRPVNTSKHPVKSSFTVSKGGLSTSRNLLYASPYLGAWHRSSGRTSYSIRHLSRRCPCSIGGRVPDRATG